MKSNHRKFLHLHTCILHYFYFYGRYNDYRHSLASTALRIGRFCRNECLQPFQTDGAQKCHHKSNEPTANPIFAYFKILTNLRAAVRLVVPSRPTNSCLPTDRSRFRICPPPKKKYLFQWEIWAPSNTVIVPWASRQTDRQRSRRATLYMYSNRLPIHCDAA